MKGVIFIDMGILSNLTALTRLIVKHFNPPLPGNRSAVHSDNDGMMENVDLKRDNMI